MESASHCPHPLVFALHVSVRVHLPKSQRRGLLLEGVGWMTLDSFCESIPESDAGDILQCRSPPSVFLDRTLELCVVRWDAGEALASTQPQP